jgi:S-adenosylmethionine hydrolase
MERRPIITLTTDFGYKDPFVGIMKGVILKINPNVDIIDITHGLTPQNVMEAAFTTEMSYSSFPAKTIHIVVIDPEVGSARRPILVVTDHHYFIGPDNGIFSQIYTLSETLTVIHITAEHYFLPHRSTTFHGRDIFAPAAAWLSKGINVSNFGEPVIDYINLKLPVPLMTKNNIIEGEVIYIDRFGNAITNIRTGKIDDLSRSNPNGKIKVLVKNKDAPIKDYYSQAGDNGIYSLINSFGYLELFIYKGSASSDFGIAVGEKVTFILS